MNRRDFITNIAMLPGIAALSTAPVAKKSAMKIHFLRHATFILEADGTRILVDPMLGAKGSMDPVGNAAHTERIPMAELPVDAAAMESLLKGLHGVIVTHTHRDHWDAAAQNLIDKNMPLLCQPSDEISLREKAFTKLLPVNTSLVFRGLNIHRTGGQHGTGDIGIQMGHVSGFVVQHAHKKLYIAGDTVWCTEVEHALATHKPDYIVLNAGAAQFLQGGAITMDAADVMRVCEAAPRATIIAVHMDTVNHCVLTRALLKKALTEKKLLHRCVIPENGATITL